MKRSSIVVAVLFGVFQLPGCSEKKPPKDHGPLGPPEAVATNTITATAMVQSIDSGNRRITLRDSDGSQHTYRCGKDVANFDQFKVGDQVIATQTDEIAIFAKKPGESPRVGISSVISRAPKGAKPGVTISESADVITKVSSVDAKARIITVDDVGGRSRTIAFDPKADVASIHAGDEVLMRCTQTVSIVVE